MSDGYPRFGVALLWGMRGVRAVFHQWLYRISPARPVIDRDIARWMELLRERRTSAPVPAGDLLWLIVRHPEFRNLFYLRAGSARGAGARVLVELAKLFYRPLESLYLFTANIGPGCFIQHGFSTGIDAKRIGANFWVNQQVSIGYADAEGCPTIGDNVSVKAGAIVLGDITIGDNVIVGAGAVVMKNVPANCVVVGVPAHIVKRDGRSVREEL